MNFVRTALLYQNASTNVSVYTGQLKPSETPVAIKELAFPSQPQAQAALTECTNMQRLTHPHICRFYGQSLETQPDGTYKVILLCELMSNDLAQEIERRKAARSYWSEADLLKMLADLVGALAYAQEQGVSHRDIKPQNIFVTDGLVKIGDFGSSVYAPQNAMQSTIKGSPLFLSPELKVMYIAAITTGAHGGFYDTYRSDVYSLGVTLMYLAYMEPPVMLGTLANLDQATETLLGGLRVYPELVTWLRVMLGANRPDFLELKRMMDSRVPLSTPAYEARIPNCSAHHASQFQELTSVCSGCGCTYWKNAGYGTYCSLSCAQMHTRVYQCTECRQNIKDLYWYTSIPQNFRHLLPKAKITCGLQCLMKAAASPYPPPMQYTPPISYAPPMQYAPLAQAYASAPQFPHQKSLHRSLQTCRACKVSTTDYVTNKKGYTYCKSCDKFFSTLQKCDGCNSHQTHCMKIGARVYCLTCKTKVNQQTSIRRQPPSGKPSKKPKWSPSS